MLDTIFEIKDAFDKQPFRLSFMVLTDIFYFLLCIHRENLTIPEPQWELTFNVLTLRWETDKGKIIIFFTTLHDSYVSYYEKYEIKFTRPIKSLTPVPDWFFQTIKNLYNIMEPV